MFFNVTVIILDSSSSAINSSDLKLRIQKMAVKP